MNKQNSVFTDNRGKIINIIEHFHGDVVYIISKKGVVRANHYHKTSGHFCYVTKGNIKYLERPVGSTDKPTITVYNAGEIFWTGPMLEHTMLFEDFVENEFMCFSTGNRSKEEYEKDLVRLSVNLETYV